MNLRAQEWFMTIGVYSFIYVHAFKYYKKEGFNLREVKEKKLISHAINLIDQPCPQILFHFGVKHTLLQSGNYVF